MRVSQVFQTCKHDSTSLVEMYSKNGAFLTTQCDLCGMCLPAILIDATTFDAWLDGRLLVPHVDNPAYDAAIGRALHDVMNGDVAGLEVFVKVARGRE